MIKLKVIKRTRTATGFSQFMKKYNVYIPGERAIRTEKPCIILLLLSGLDGAGSHQEVFHSQLMNLSINLINN